MLVVDASVLVTALADDDEHGDGARARLRGERVIAPDVVDLEVVSVLRRQVRSGEVSERRAAQALRDLADLPMVRVPHRRLLARVWELRENITVYDAAYVAVAEAAGAVLLTGDGRPARAPGPRCAVEVLQAGAPPPS